MTGEQLLRPGMASCATGGTGSRGASTGTDPTAKGSLGIAPLARTTPLAELRAMDVPDDSAGTVGKKIVSIVSDCQAHTASGRPRRS